MALNNGHLDGKVTVLVYQNGCVSNDAMTACEDHVKDCKKLTQFNVKPEENWILYHDGKGEVVYGKAKRKLFGKYETWITNDKQIRDPHACLAKDQVCKVSIFRLSNSWHLQKNLYDCEAVRRRE